MNGISERFTTWLKDHDLTGHKINKEIGLSKASISEWSRGLHDPSPKGLLLLNKHYNLPIDYILTGDLDSLTESNLINNFRNLSESQQEAVVNFIEKLNNKKD